MSISDTSIESLGFAKFLGQFRGGAETGQAMRALGSAITKDVGSARASASAHLKANKLKYIINGVFLLIIVILFVVAGLQYKKAHDNCSNKDDDSVSGAYKTGMITFAIGATCFFILTMINFFMKDTRIE